MTLNYAYNENRESCVCIPFTSKTLRAFLETIQTHILHEAKLHVPNNHSNRFVLPPNSAIHGPSTRTLFIRKILKIIYVPLNCKTLNELNSLYYNHLNRNELTILCNNQYIDCPSINKSLLFFFQKCIEKLKKKNP